MSFLKLKKQILDTKEITDTEFDDIANFFKIQKIEAKKYIFKKGQICDCIAFVSKGCLVFYSKYNNKERVINFLTEGSWVGDLNSFMNKKPTDFYLKTLENTELLTIDYESFMSLIKNHPNYTYYHLLATHKMYLNIEERLALSSALSAEERYNLVMKNDSDIVNRVPSKYLASYLGIEPPSLSRVRRKIIDKL